MIGATLFCEQTFTVDRELHTCSRRPKHDGACKCFCGATMEIEEEAHVCRARCRWCGATIYQGPLGPDHWRAVLVHKFGDSPCAARN